MASVLMNSTLVIQWCARFGSRRAREVRVGCPLPRRAEHAFATIILDLNVFEWLLLLHPASQLRCGAEDARGAFCSVFFYQT